MIRTLRIRRPRLSGMACLLCVVASISSHGCATVQPWERETLSSDAMAAEISVCHRFEHNNEVYREGAVGANGGKGGGGCGCT